MDINMEAMLKRVRKSPKVSSKNTVDKYKCDKCRDTSWIQGEGGMRRCECYKETVNVRRWAKFGVDPRKIKKINQYDPINEIQELAKQKAVEYVKGFDIKKDINNGIAFLGQPGAGKTHLTLGIGKALMEKKTPLKVVYMPYLEVIRQLKMNTRDTEFYSKLQNRYINAEILIIDDLFKDKISRGELKGELTTADRNHIYPIINQRYIAGKHTIFSSECDADMLMELDDALAGRILEMCRGNLIIFKYGNENNYRLRGV